MKGKWRIFFFYISCEIQGLNNQKGRPQTGSALFWWDFKFLLSEEILVCNSQYDYSKLRSAPSWPLQSLSLTNNCIFETGIWFEILNSPPNTNTNHEKEAVGRKGIFSFFVMATLQIQQGISTHSLTGKTVLTGCEPLGKLLNTSFCAWALK